MNRRTWTDDTFTGNEVLHTWGSHHQLRFIHLHSSWAPIPGRIVWNTINCCNDVCMHACVRVRAYWLSGVGVSIESEGISHVSCCSRHVPKGKHTLKFPVSVDRGFTSLDTFRVKPCGMRFANSFWRKSCTLFFLAERKLIILLPLSAYQKRPGISKMALSLSNEDWVIEMLPSCPPIWASSAAGMTWSQLARATVLLPCEMGNGFTGKLVPILT